MRQVAANDLLTGLIAYATLTAGVEHLERSPEKSRLYAALDRPPPDSERRFIPVQSLARSLGLPRETVRRRVVSAAMTGGLELGPEGVRAPLEAVMRPEQLSNLHATRDAALALLAQLGLPCLESADGHGPYVDRMAVEARVRQLMRIHQIFVMRTYEAASVMGAGDLKRGLVLAAMLWNVITETDRLALADLGPVTAIAGRGVARAVIGADVFIHRETLRRVLTRLVAEGDLEARGREMALTPAFLRGERFAEAQARTTVALNQMLRSLVSAELVVAG